MRAVNPLMDGVISANCKFVLAPLLQVIVPDAKPSLPACVYCPVNEQAMPDDQFTEIERADPV